MEKVLLQGINDPLVDKEMWIAPDRRVVTHNRPVVTHKECGGCHNVLPIESFVSGSGKTRYGKCPTCRKIESHREYAAKKRLSTKEVKLALLSQFGMKCSRCGYDEFPSALEFHHRNRRQKDSQVSQLTGQYCTTPSDTNWDRLMAECGKCDVLCSNCHQAMHAGEW